MKRLLLLPILMFGLSFACDQPYEEVAGIKIGCSLGSSVDYKKYTSGNDMYGGGMVFRRMERPNPFDLEVVLSVDGIVEGMVLSTPKGSITNEDFIVLVSSMKERWGTPILDSDMNSVSATFDNSGSEVVDYVTALFAEDNGSLYVAYRTKKSLEAEERQKNRDKAKLKQKFEGL